jgi:hypothetical protein
LAEGGIAHLVITPNFSPTLGFFRRVDIHLLRAPPGMKKSK